MNKTDKYQYDYIIVGNGLAGFQLALAFSRDSFFENKSIALIDKDTKKTNDKTWSFWEIGDGNWDSIVKKKWQKSRFISHNLDITQNLSPYIYKSIPSIEFYKYAKSILDNRSNFTFIHDSINVVKEVEEMVLVEGEQNSYRARHVFDSRIPIEYYQDEASTKLHQHFKGYFIECEQEIFDPDTITFMDYRLRHNNSTSFIYVLPTSNSEALIEYTFFTPNLVDDSVYDRYIKDYIDQYLKINNYQIKEIEAGNIPMTDFKFEKLNTELITKIGTGGGWVKGSTGYSFKHTEFKVEKIIDNIKAGHTPSKDLFKKRFKLYDSIFLKVLYDYNEQGMTIFEKFYSKNSPKETLQFLDEATTFSQEIKIMMSMYSKEFVISFIKKLLR